MLAARDATKLVSKVLLMAALALFADPLAAEPYAYVTSRTPDHGGKVFVIDTNPRRALETIDLRGDLPSLNADVGGRGMRIVTIPQENRLVVVSRNPPKLLVIEDPASSNRSVDVIDLPTADRPTDVAVTPDGGQRITRRPGFRQPPSRPSI